MGNTFSTLDVQAAGRLFNNLIRDSEALDEGLLAELQTLYPIEAAWQIMRNVHSLITVGVPRSEAIETAEAIYASGYAPAGL